MASALFWQRPMDSWDWQTLQDFLAEDLPENQRLEYKRANINDQSGRWELDPELVETLVAYANTDDGLLFIGVSERGDKRPGGIVGIPHKDPENALRNYCATAIEPAIGLEVQTVKIPEGEPRAGNKLLVARVRRGVNPPYLVRGHGVFLRFGDQDRHATVRDLQAPFERRTHTAGIPIQSWEEVRRRIFQPLNFLDSSLPPVFAVGLTPVFPGEPVEMTEATDAVFSHLVQQALGVHQQRVFLEQQGASYTAHPETPSPDNAKTACAFSDGSVGLRAPLPLALDQEGGWRKISVTYLWQELRRSLVTAADWSRGACGVTGPLQYIIGLGNIADAVLTLNPEERIDAHVIALLLQPPQQRNRVPFWITSGEWDIDQDVNDVIGRELAGLSRVLQARFYPVLREQIRRWVGG